MKILSGNLKDKDINISCKYCNANFNLESKDDFYINNWIYKPINKDGICDYNIKIPEYNIKCPVCDNIIYIGIDPLDCGKDFNKGMIRGAYANIIFNRKDWEERYKIKVKTMGKSKEYLFDENVDKKDIKEIAHKTADKIIQEIFSKDRSGEMLYYFVKRLQAISKLCAYRGKKEYSFYVLTEDKYKELQDK